MGGGGSRWGKRFKAFSLGIREAGYSGSGKGLIGGIDGTIVNCHAASWKNIKTSNGDRISVAKGSGYETFIFLRLGNDNGFPNFVIVSDTE